MPQVVIVYGAEGGGLGLVAPDLSTGLSIDQLREKLVPPGAPSAVITDEDYPGDEAYRDAWEADFSQTPVVLTVNLEKVDAIGKQFALADLEEWFQAQIDAGFQTAGGWTLGLTPTDVTLLTGNYVLAKESAAMGGPIPPVFDKDGMPHPIEAIEELTAIMLAYGQRRAEISAEYAAKRAAILG